jgi:phenylalanyl-tRNA synthetase beta chain
MIILQSWLSDYVDVNLSAKELADKFTSIGIEVDSMEEIGANFSGVHVAQITKIEKHPNADKLFLVTLDTGSDKQTVVCGAKNIEVGQKVPLARVGAKLPGDFTLTKAKIRGIESQGMICSAKELNVGDKDASGIMVFDDNAKIGHDVSKMFDEKDCIFDLAIIPNRPDLLSHLGVARELATALKQPLKEPVKLKISETKETIPVKIHAPEGCPRYTGRIIKNVNACESPLWLKKRLKAIGVNPKNALVDVTNYILHDLGQPVHAFDFDLLFSKQIEIEWAKQGESFTSLDNTELTLSPEMLMICDGDKPEAIAGVMGGLETAVTEKTKNIYLESAYFDPICISKSSKKANIKSDASKRFEGGCDITILNYASAKVAYLLREICGDGVEICQITDDYPKEHKTKIIEFVPEDITKVLGMEIPEKDMLDILKRIGKNVEKGKKWKFEVPLHRHDLETKWDLAEEAAKFYGYDSIPEGPCDIVSFPQTAPKTQSVIENISNTLAGLGFCEIRSFDFISVRETLTYTTNPDGELKLANPLSSDHVYLRGSLLPSLLKAATANERKGTAQYKIFEIGKAYKNQKHHFESNFVAGLMCGNYPSKTFWKTGETKPLDFYHLKGVMETLIGDTKGAELVPSKTAKDFIHPKLSMDICLNKEIIGTFGKIHPVSVSKFELKGKDVWYFELNIDKTVAVSESIRDTKVVMPFEFPTSWRDISFTIDKNVDYSHVSDCINKHGGECLIGVRLTDLYQGQNIGEGKKSVTIRLVFGSGTETLKDAQINSAFENIISGLSKTLGAVLR